MAEQKKKPSAFDGVGGKTTPVLIDKLPKEVQAALRRQLQYNTTTGQEINRYNKTSSTSVGEPRSLDNGFVSRSSFDHGMYGGADVPKATAAQDAAVLRQAGLSGRTILDKSVAGTGRQAFTVDADGMVTQVAERSPYGSTIRGSGGPEVHNSFGLFSDAPAGEVGGRPVGAISASRQGIKLPPKMTARGMSILDAGPAMYQLMTDNVDTDFTVKMIPPQFRKPDETGKMREAVVIVDGQPFVQYEGEAFNIPGFEDVGDELASYFREHSSEAMGKNKLGADVAGTSMEVRESEKQAMDKKVQAGAQEAAGSSGPRKGGAPTFAGEYQVGRKSAEPRLPKTDEVLRKMN